MEILREAFIVALALPGCFAGAAQTAAPPAGGPVSLVISVERQVFDAGSTLDVRVWTAAQLAALAGNARCGIVRDVASGAEQATCPNGVVYQRVLPEHLRVPLTGDTIEVRPGGLSAGETFRVQVSGRSRDGCNTTSATVERAARAGRNFLTDVAWQTTTRACLKGDER